MSTTFCSEFFPSSDHNNDLCSEFVPWSDHSNGDDSNLLSSREHAGTCNDLSTCICSTPEPSLPRSACFPKDAHVPVSEQHCCQTAVQMPSPQPQFAQHNCEPCPITHVCNEAPASFSDSMHDSPFESSDKQSGRTSVTFCQSPFVVFEMPAAPSINHGCHHKDETTDHVESTMPIQVETLSTARLDQHAAIALPSMPVLLDDNSRPHGASHDPSAYKAPPSTWMIADLDCSYSSQHPPCPNQKEKASAGLSRTDRSNQLRNLSARTPRGWSFEHWAERFPCPGCGSKHHRDCRPRWSHLPADKGPLVTTLVETTAQKLKAKEVNALTHHKSFRCLASHVEHFRTNIQESVIGMITSKQASLLPFALVHARNFLYGKGRWLAARLRVKHFAGMILQHGPVQIEKPPNCTKAHVLFWLPNNPKLHYCCTGIGAQVDLNELGVSSDTLDDINLIVILESDSPSYGESQDTRVEAADQQQKGHEHPVLGAPNCFIPMPYPTQKR